MAEPELIYSPLQQRYAADGKAVDVCIYRLPDTGWTLEVVDQFGNSLVWEEVFASDQAAYDVFLEEVREEGIDSMIGQEPGEPVN